MGKPLRVLIVEDSEDDTLLIARLLRVGGFELTYERVDSAAALRAALAEKPWDVVICDHSLPNFDSLAALAITREGGRDLPFIIVSGVIDEEHAVAAMQAGAHDYLMKGNLVRLAPAIEREVAEAEGRRKRRRAERALRESNDHLRAIMDNVSDGIVTIDEQGAVISVNHAAERMFGYSAEELLGQNVKILMPDPDRGRHDDYIANYLRTGKGRILGIGPREVVGRRGNGAVFPLELAISEMRAGAKRMFIGVVRDITQRKNAEGQLRQAQKMEAVGQLTGGIAHDFNNLLSIIIGNLDWLLMNLEKPEQREVATEALDGALRGAELTKQMLAFARRQPLDPVMIDIADLLMRAATMLRRTLGEAITVSVAPAAELWPCVADPSQLESVLLNLAINARDAMPKGGSLIIEATNAHLDQHYADQNDEVTPGDYVRISVSDMGAGIPAEILVRVTEPFFTTKALGKGTGLGLSMAYGFAKQSRGNLKIYSEEGHGTTVNLYLPRAGAMEKTDAADHSPGKPEVGGHETILVVDDNIAVRKSAVRQLRDLGYDIIEAEDARLALGILAHGHKVDLLFSDIVMPGGMNGIDLAQEVRRLYPAMKILLVTGFTESAARSRDGFGKDIQLMTKPYRRRELAARIREILETT